MKNFKFFILSVFILLINIESIAQTVCSQEQNTFEVIVASQELTTINGVISLSIKLRSLVPQILDGQISLLTPNNDSYFKMISSISESKIKPKNLGD